MNNLFSKPYKPRKRLANITSYQDLLFKSETQREYLDLMFRLVRSWRCENDTVTMTRNEAVAYLDERVEEHGNCQYIVQDANDIIYTYSLYEDSGEPKPEKSDNGTFGEISWDDMDRIISFKNREIREENMLYNWRPLRFVDPPAPEPVNPNTVLPEPEPTHTPQEGEMCEYGWYDRDVEQQIIETMARFELPRNDAIIRIFNDAAQDTRL